MNFFVQRFYYKKSILGLKTKILGWSVNLFYSLYHFLTKKCKKSLNVSDINNYSSNLLNRLIHGLVENQLSCLTQTPSAEPHLSEEVSSPYAWKHRAGNGDQSLPRLQLLIIVMNQGPTGPSFCRSPNQMNQSLPGLSFGSHSFHAELDRSNDTKSKHSNVKTKYK